MIRECIYSDIDSINNLGTILHDNFKDLFNIKNILDDDYSKIYVYEENNVVLGFIHIERHFEIIDIINVIVDKSHERKGIGSSLIEYVKNHENYERILLEVNEFNISAINLYKKSNFKEISRRKNYYGNDDAIVMEMIK